VSVNREESVCEPREGECTCPNRRDTEHRTYARTVELNDMVRVQHVDTVGRELRVLDGIQLVEVVVTLRVVGGTPRRLKGYMRVFTDGQAVHAHHFACHLQLRSVHEQVLREHDTPAILDADIGHVKLERLREVSDGVTRAGQASASSERWQPYPPEPSKQHASSQTTYVSSVRVMRANVFSMATVVMVGIMASALEIGPSSTMSVPALDTNHAEPSPLTDFSVSTARAPSRSLGFAWA